MAEFLQLPLSRIKPSVYQARKTFDAVSLQELAHSMREAGLIEPIVVRQISDVGFRTSDLQKNPKSALRNPKFFYELISGERRLRAAKKLGWKTIAAVVQPIESESEAAVKGLIENLQRENLNPVEEAEGFATLQKLDKKRWTQSAIGKSIGKDQVYVSRSMSLLGLAEPILKNMRQRIISREHGIELARLNSKDLQLEVAGQIKDVLTVKETRHLVDTILRETTPTPPTTPPPPISRPPVHPEQIDPLMALWGIIRSAFKLPEGVQWSVDYPQPGRWLFSVSADPDRAVDHLQRWAEELARILESPDSHRLRNSPKLSQMHQDLAVRVMNTQEEGPMIDDVSNARVPETPVEWSDFEEAVLQSPSAMYYWIYGPQSQIAASTKDMTWADFGAKDPVKAAREIVKSLQ